MQRENQFRASIHKHLTPEKPHHEKMHNPFRRGTADDWYSGREGDIWVEYKWVSRLASIQADRLLTPLQNHWHEQRHAEGRQVFMIVGFPQGGIIIHPRDYSRRIPVPEVEERLRKRKEIAAWIEFQTMGLDEDVDLQAE